MSLIKFLTRKKAKPSAPLRYEAEARLYEFEDRFFVCSVSGIAETKSLSVLDADVDDEAIGSSILHHLSQYDPEWQDLYSLKKSDWPAYQASGAKSLKAFEQKLWHIDLALMNSAVLIWASPRIATDDCELSAFASANRNLPGKVGNALRAALSAAKVLRAKGVL